MVQSKNIQFRLYIADHSLNSAPARANLSLLCQEHFAGRYDIDVVDVFTEPERALADGVFMTPTLVRLAPLPLRTVAGPLRDRHATMEAFAIRRSDSLLKAGIGWPAESRTGEIQALIEILHQTEERLDALTAGEIDTVANHAGRVLMLGRAQEYMRATEVRRLGAIVDAMPGQIALIDANGAIVAVNAAWRRFALANGMRSADHGLGLNYLDACDLVRGP
ncbi:MAG: circadian clock KaiB family protein, partial [Burkholderiaceae bacterium]